MLKLDPTSKTLEAVSSTTLAQARILERADLQAEKGVRLRLSSENTEERDLRRQS